MSEAETPFETLKIETRGRVRIVRFARPDQLNAMSSRMIGEILAAVEVADADPAVGAIVLCGEGKAFMAGADIKEYAALDARGFRRFQREGRRIYETLERSPKPVVAAVGGYALGGGFEIALACDLVVARAGARMGLPEIRLGLVPGGGGTQRLARKIGPNRAFEVLATGDPLTAEDFAALGLVSRVVDGDPLEEAVALAAQLAEHPAAPLAALKALVQLSGESGMAAALDREAEALQRLFETTDARERIAAFAARSEERRGKDAKT